MGIHIHAVFFILNTPETNTTPRRGFYGFIRSPLQVSRPICSLLTNIIVFLSAYIYFSIHMKEQIQQRVSGLRAYMKAHGLNAFIFPSTDPHMSEYAPDHWKAREWISGFNGSAGTAVVTDNKAALWTDSRYFLAAGEQLEGTPFELMRQGLPETPSLSEWLVTVLPEGSTVGLDGLTNTAAFTETLRQTLQKQGIGVNTSCNPAAELWTDRPQLPDAPVCEQPLAFAGLSRVEKIQTVRDILTGQQCDGILISALDEIAWLLNLRGTDVECNPVFVSYLLLTQSDATLFIAPEKLTAEVTALLCADGIGIRPYTAVAKSLAAYPHSSLSLCRATTCHTLASALPATCLLQDLPSPVALLKAIKNEAEITGFRHAMLRDGVAMVKFLKWLKPAVEQGGQTELSVTRKLEALRAEGALYRDISFATITGYAAHGAIVHYEPSEETDIALKPEGLVLIDSGAQYQDGTTDITRTIALGPLTELERTDYTLVLKGHIALARARFPEGTTGTQLDILARQALWNNGLNYGHGTGHGVGSYLNVHEGPHQIRMNHMPTPLQAGMTVTNEPGLYRAGQHGIRIENVELVVPFTRTDFGSFLQFEALTLCPIDTAAIRTELMTPDELTWLNDYHRRVYKTLSPLLDEEHRTWLAEATQPLS